MSQLPEKRNQEPILVVFHPGGETVALAGVELTRKEKDHQELMQVGSYLLLALDGFEIMIGFMAGEGFDVITGLAIGATSLAALGCYIFSKGRARSNFFQIEGDSISFSRNEDYVGFYELLLRLGWTKPSVARWKASNIEKIDIILDDAVIFLKNGKKATIELQHLEAKRTIQDALLYFCEQWDIPSFISPLALQERSLYTLK